MILTRDNLLRFIREQKYVTPTLISEKFETTTMIASAALSELAKENLIQITQLKLSSSPYYYDPNQKEALVELGQKHFSSYDKEIFEKIKTEEIVNHNALTIQLALAAERIKDFAKELLIEYQGKELKFWVWYLRDINETKKLIIDALEGNSKETKNEEKSQVKEKLKEIKEDKEIKVEKKEVISNQELKNEEKATFEKYELPNLSTQQDSFESKVENFISSFFTKHYLKVESMSKEEKATYYVCKLKVHSIEIIFDCVYFSKKIQDADLIKFYTSSQNPKIVFLENVAKKLEKLAENLENLSIINI